ncbi:MAG: efflux RND transporter periplasmic adaptor subunit [Planctomycetota bacterium]|jgi:Cu(I)/Ag(I) efflux system membrane fusion protein
MAQSKLKPAGVVAGGLLCAVLLFWIGRATAPAGGAAAPAAGAAQTPTIWYCSMHPQIKQPMPGKCPICAMDLIPLQLSAAAKALAEIETATVRRRFATKTVRMVGKVEYDETRVRSIASWINGRIDRLFVDYTGTPVRAGDHLVKIYSPELLSAQQELLEAKAQVDAHTPETSEFLRGSNARALGSAREKLRLWGLSGAQVAAIEARGTAEDRVEITAPMGGVVIHKGVHEGMYVKTGSVMYRIADLSHLWVQLEAYESDLAWLRYGQGVVVTTEAHPGEAFEGTIAFIAPQVDPRTRTVMVRVNVPNPDGRLRPGMFARGQVRARVAQGGKVMEPSLAGKWVCPMHPAVVKDANEPCDICGMDLVKAEELGFEVADTTGEQPLVVPVTAVLRTGRRAVVYVAVPGAAEPTYEGRVIVLGARADDVYLVRSGLREGEEVVVRGAFKIDSALQIQAKPSMMSMPAGPVRDRVMGSDAARAALAPVYTGGLALHEALAADDVAAAAAAWAALPGALREVAETHFDGRARERWLELRGLLQRAVTAGAAAADLAASRTAFREWSNAVLQLEETFGHGGTTAYVRAHCPMAFDNAGASWLQTGEKIRNPYFGAAMYACGTVEETFAPQAAAATGPGQPVPPAKRGSGPAPGPKAPGTPGVAPLEHPLARVWRGYLALQEALAADDAPAAAERFAELGRAAAAVSDTALPDEARGAWGTAQRELRGAAADAAADAALGRVRVAFRRASRALITLAEGAPAAVAEPVVKVFCPMAFDNAGAAWLQRGERIANPWFGAAMPRCGTVQQRWPAGRGK